MKNQAISTSTIAISAGYVPTSPGIYIRPIDGGEHFAGLFEVIDGGGHVLAGNLSASDALSCRRDIEASGFAG